MFNVLLEWINVVNDLPEGSPYLTLEKAASSHQNDNIPKSAIIALGSCLDTFLQTEKVPIEFRIYILEMVMRRISNLSAEGVVGRYRKIAIESILQRGARGPEETYGYQVKRCYDQIDHTVQWELKDFEAELARTYSD